VKAGTIVTRILFEQVRESKAVEEFKLSGRKFGEKPWRDFIPQGRKNIEKWKIYFCYQYPITYVKSVILF